MPSPDHNVPLDTPPRVDANGIDLSMIEDCLRLTPAQRLQKHYELRLAAQAIRRAGERFYGSAHPDIEEI